MSMFHFLRINFFQRKLSNIQAQNVLQKPSETKTSLVELALKNQITAHYKNAAR